MKKRYYIRQIKVQNKRYYSLNFLFAQLHKNDREEKDHGEKPLPETSHIHHNDELALGRFYKSISSLIE